MQKTNKTMNDTKKIYETNDTIKSKTVKKLFTDEEPEKETKEAVTEKETKETVTEKETKQVIEKESEKETKETVTKKETKETKETVTEKETDSVPNNVPNKKIENKTKLFGKLTKKQEEVDSLFNPDENGVSVWVLKEEISQIKLLNWGNNGIARHGVFFNDNRYIWEKSPKTGKIEKLRTNGYNQDLINNLSRPIRKDIEKYHKKFGCVVCGSHSDLITDHKNDLYNDPRVLNIKTQKIDDFQCLCNHCNLQKRQVAKKTIETKKRYSAKNIPSLKVFNIDFIEGNKEFDINDPNAMKGTYWYDPVAFMQYIKENK